ncbi:MAG: alpha/beta fold hydrolase [Chitinophagaceae bacterium]|nr:alpha/beta fold hydrolase [Chitinophagaceae bacterium]
MRKLKLQKIIHILLLFAGQYLPVKSQVIHSASHTDTSHYSKVFNHDKYYRIYLPKGYDTSRQKYPVIYFFHGWGERYFKDSIALPEPEKIKALVDKHQLIIVMWDGNIDTAEPRPYNTGDHEHVQYDVQMKDYFLELINHIDDTYRTLQERQHRGIIGFSMGGFMSFFMAGKYPDKVSAAVSMAGSPEFFIGSPGNHTLYPVRYMFNNLQDVKIRLHNGDTDILYYLNDEVQQGAICEGIPLDYWKFHGGHVVDKPGEVKVLESAIQFVKAAFSTRPQLPQRWTHTDIYPEFSVWDYTVTTNKNKPGYTTLTNVDNAGFGLHQLKWLPGGTALYTGAVQVTTAPLYTPGKQYNVVTYTKRTGQISDAQQQADANGRLYFSYSQPGIETGIYSADDQPSFIVLDHSTSNNTPVLYNGKRGSLSVRLLNRGNAGLPTGKLKIRLSCTDTAVHFLNNPIEVNVKCGQRIIHSPVFSIFVQKKLPQHAEPPSLNIKVTIDYNDQRYHDKVIVPVLYDAPVMDSIQIDDRRTVRDRAFGTGNGNGVADAGEKIMVYTGAHRVRLYTDDKWVIQDETELVDEMIPAIWPDGFTMSSVVKISPDCPDGHTINFYGSFETKTFDPIERKTTWGRINITVHNTRSTNRKK